MNNSASTLPDWFLVALPSVLLVLIIWTMFWKGIGLWHAARNKDVGWFVVFLMLNTVGILELIYLGKTGKLKKNKLFKK